MSICFKMFCDSHTGAAYHNFYKTFACNMFVSSLTNKYCLRSFMTRKYFLHVLGIIFSIWTCQLRSEPKYRPSILVQIIGSLPLHWQFWVLIFWLQICRLFYVGTFLGASKIYSFIDVHIQLRKFVYRHIKDWIRTATIFFMLAPRRGALFILLLPFTITSVFE